MREFTKGDMLIAHDGRIGLLAEAVIDDNALLQFGSDGPFRTYRASACRWATEDEIHEADLGGVGRNPSPAEAGRIVNRHRHA